MESTPLTQPLLVLDDTILEPGSPVVWFTFDDSWHDIGRFHVGDRFTGYYANILTPVVFRSPTRWETTDLFLDVWLGADGALLLLDEEEFNEACGLGWVSDTAADAARREADRLLSAASAGTWPPPVAREWTLRKAREHGTRSADTV
ncbi:hypothetical protein BH23GEM9_BH23GEM9_34850 [soil metagenome]